MSDLRSALHEQAETMTPHRDLGQVMHRVEQHRRRVRQTGLVATFALVAVAVAGIVVLGRGDSDKRVTSSRPPAPLGAIVIDGATSGGSLDRHDSTANDGPWTVTARGIGGSLGVNSAVVTYPVTSPRLFDHTVAIGAVQGVVVGGNLVVWPIGDSYAQVRGDVKESELVRIAVATHVAAGRPVVDPLIGYAIGVVAPYRAVDVHEVRYEPDSALADTLGFVYTGVLAGGGFEDQLFQTRRRTGYSAAGHAAVASPVNGGNGTLAWEQSPGVIAYVGYSGRELNDTSIAALVTIAARTSVRSAAQWGTTNPQVVEQTNGPTFDDAAPTVASIGCGATPSQGSAGVPDWGLVDAVPGEGRYVVSVGGDVVVYSFARPLLVSPRAGGPLNKVLLMTKNPTQRLKVIASLGSTTLDDSRSNPSGAVQFFDGYLDVNAPGCWRFDITAAGQTDTVYLLYS